MAYGASVATDGPPRFSELQAFELVGWAGVQDEGVYLDPSHREVTDRP